MIDQDKPENRVAAIIIACAIEVHRTLGGPGLLERIYEEALMLELIRRGLRVERQRPVPVVYKGTTLDAPLVLDMVVEDLVVVENKATTVHNDIFESQLLTYLRVTGLRLGLLINFGERRVADGIHRVVNGL